MITVKPCTLDIVDCDTDAIVNSVGTNPNVYGGLCAAIIKGAKSKELVHELDLKLGKLKAEDMFVTPGYALPCKEIIHVVTPDYNDDPDFAVYKKIIHSILQYCLDHKIESVVIGKIGTGANHYPSEKALNVINEECVSFMMDYVGSSTLAIYINTFTKKAHGFFQSSGDFIETEMRLKQAVYHGGRSNWGNYPGSNREPILMGMHDSHLAYRGYVERYMELREIQENEPFKEQKKRLYMFVGSDADKGAKILSNYIDYYESMPKKHVVFLTAVALKMSYPEARQLFEYAGYGLSPIIPVDQFYLEMILKQQFDWQYITQAYFDRFNKSIYPSENSHKKYAKAAHH